MKTKNRLLLTSAMMLALVAVSGTTATYAWWVAGLSASASVNSVTAAADASLTLSLTNVANTSVDTTKNEVSIVTDGKLTDVTTANGKAFQKATLNSSGKPASLVDVDITKPYADNVYYAISFKATIGMALTGDLSYNVYLGDGDATSLIEESDPEKAVRMSVTVGDNTFIVGNGESLYQKDISSTAAYTSAYKQLTGAITEKTTDTSVGVFGTDYCLGTLTKNVTSIAATFTMWFEGALTKDQVQKAEDTFKANLYFYSVRIIPAQQA